MDHNYLLAFNVYLAYRSLSIKALRTNLVAPFFFLLIYPAALP
jgi:hypothetical protein